MGKGWTQHLGNVIFPPQQQQGLISIMWFFKSILTWWHDKTIGTAWFTFRKGQKAGEDDQGNIYYQERGGNRRWVIYNGDIDASRVPPEWHRWLHYTSDKSPVDAPLPVKSWEKPHRKLAAIMKPGSLNRRPIYY